MESLQEIIRGHLDNETYDALRQSGDVLAEALQEAAWAVCDSLMNDGKVLCGGCGTGAVLAQCLSAYLVNGFEQERMPLAALALGTESAVVSGSLSEAAAVRQIRAFGKGGDILWVSALPNDDVLAVEMVTAAHEQGMRVVALTGGNGGAVVEVLGERDIWLNVPDDRAARVAEVHLLMIHALCAAIDAVILEGMTA